jgi:4-amino-4-deoxy-L-arabinose transferase-like glycosyltransferase
MGRILTSGKGASTLVVVAAVAPRLALLLHERGNILASFTEKSDDFAQTLVKSGTFGFIPGVPSAYTQPLYGWFLAVLYWVIERHWLVVGLAQTAVAAATALVVLWTGRRFVSSRAGLLAALVSTLHPYLIWHDIHVNREILDQLVAALAFAVTLVIAGTDRARHGSLLRALVLGVVLGLAILGNTRLAALPLFLAAYLLWTRAGVPAVLVLLVACALTLVPWVVRNRVQVGCYTVTTDARALWKANNVNTYSTLAHGGWIDDVPPLPGAPPSPEDAADRYRATGTIIPVDECAQMRLFRHETVEFWKQHPGEKLKLMQQAVRMLWDPRPIRTETGPDAGGNRSLRTWAEASYAIPLFLLTLLGIGLRVVPLRFLLLALLFIVYETLAAMLFAGATRYRVPWDFVLALLAAAAVDRVLTLRSSTAR